MCVCALCVGIHMCVYNHMCLCSCLCACVWVYTCVFVCACMCMCVCSSICMCYTAHVQVGDSFAELAPSFHLDMGAKIKFRSQAFETNTFTSWAISGAPTNPVFKTGQGWGYNSVLDSLLSIHKVLSRNSSAPNKSKSCTIELWPLHSRQESQTFKVICRGWFWCFDQESVYWHPLPSIGFWSINKVANTQWLSTGDWTLSVKWGDWEREENSRGDKANQPCEFRVSGLWSLPWLGLE